MYSYKNIYSELGEVAEDNARSGKMVAQQRWRFRDGGLQSVPWPDHSNCECCLPSGELESWLPGLQLMPTKVAYSWRLEKLFQRQFQITVE